MVIFHAGLYLKYRVGLSVTGLFIDCHWVDLYVDGNVGNTFRFGLTATGYSLLGQIGKGRVVYLILFSQEIQTNPN